MDNHDGIDTEYMTPEQQAQAQRPDGINTSYRESGIIVDRAELERLQAAARKLEAVEGLVSERIDRAEKERAKTWRNGMDADRLYFTAMLDELYTIKHQLAAILDAEGGE